MTRKETIENFYAAFARLDAQGMARCYADGAQFEDEVFTLKGKREVAGMWRMLCEATQAKGADVWRLEYSVPEGERAQWDAYYRFSATGRMVHNSVRSRFEFDERGLIVRQRDRFPFWRWSRQALGLPGVLLGWTPLLRNKVRRQADANLRRFLAQ